MRLVVVVLLAAACTFAAAHDDAAAIQRALIQRDQQSAEFAARVRGDDVARLEALHARQLQEPVQPIPQFRPYQRQRMAEERTLTLSPPIARAPPAVSAFLRVLPLPGGPRHGVDPIPAQGLGH
jgi:hypothetical protein